MEVLLIMLVIPPLGGGLLLSEWQSRSALGREQRTLWRWVVCGLGALLLPIGLGMIYFAVQHYLDFNLTQSLLLVGQLLLSAAILLAGTTAVRVGLIADELDLFVHGSVVRTMLPG